MGIAFFSCYCSFLLLFSLGIAYILATAYVFFGDVKHLYSVLLTLWMYCSAIFYPVESLHGIIRIVISYNPIFNYIDALRQVVMYGQLPPGIEVVRMAVWGIVMYLIGYHIFKKHKISYAENLMGAVMRKRIQIKFILMIITVFFLFSEEQIETKAAGERAYFGSEEYEWGLDENCIDWHLCRGRSQFVRCRIICTL